MEDALVEFLVQIIETVVEGEHDKLRSVSGGQVARNLGSTTVTVWKTTCPLVTLGC